MYSSLAHTSEFRVTFVLFWKSKEAGKRASQKIFLICFTRTFHFSSYIEKKKKKDKFGTQGLKPTSVLPWNRCITLMTQLHFLGLFKTKKQLFFFSSQSTVFLQQQWKWDHSSLTWPFYKALYKWWFYDDNTVLERKSGSQTWMQMWNDQVIHIWHLKR